MRGVNIFRILIIFLLVGVGSYSLRLRSDPDIRHFLPETRDSRQFHLSRLFRGTRLSRGMLFSVTLRASENPVDGDFRFIDRFMDALSASGLFADLDDGRISADLEEKLAAYYFPRRYRFASLNPEREIPRLLSEKSIDSRVKRLKRDLGTSMGQFMKRYATRDPLQLYPDILHRLKMAGAPVRPATWNGRYMSPDHTAWLIVGETRADPFDLDAQETVLHAVNDIFQKINRNHQEKFALDFTGVNRFALDARRLIKRDINQAFLLSFLGAIVIFILFFRSARLLFLAFLPVPAGVVFALGSATLIFGRLHGITIAFGSTLIGICIDYPVHLVNHYGLTGERKLPKSLRMSLLVSWLTTLAGFAVLEFSAFPGIRQIAVFAMSGIAFAFLFTRLILPMFSRWIPVRSQESRLDDCIVRIRRTAVSHRRLGAGISLALVLCAMISFYHLRIQTDVKSLNSTDPVTVAVDQRIRGWLPVSGFPVYLIVSGDSREEAMVENERIYNMLTEWKRSGKLAAFFSVSPFFFSRSLQNRNQAAFKARTDLSDVVFRTLAKNGFKAGKFAAFQQDFIHPAPAGNQAEELPASINVLIDQFFLESDSRFFIVNLLKTKGNASEIISSFDDDPDVTVFHRADLLNTVVTTSQKEMLTLITWGSLVVIAILLVYQRNVILTLTSIFPAIGAAIITVAIIRLTMGSLNMMHVLSLLLILCMGADYGIFITEQFKHGRKGVNRHFFVAVRSVLVSALTTLFAFGVLALSRNVALRSVGITVGSGIIISCLLAFFFNIAILTRQERSDTCST